MKIVAAFLLCLAGALGLRGQAALGLPVRADIALPERAVLPAPGQSIEEIDLRQLLTLKRVFVDRMTGGETAAQMRDIVISSLEESKLFIVTENQEKADATLRGAAEDLVYTESYGSSAGINGHLSVGTGKGVSDYRLNNNGSLGIGETESDHSTVRRHEALATVRITNKEGDVIWSTTQESIGAKYHGASVDVAEKIAAQLKEDFEKAKKLAR